MRSLGRDAGLRECSMGNDLGWGKDMRQVDVGMCQGQSYRTRERDTGLGRGSMGKDLGTRGM